MPPSQADQSAVIAFLERQGAQRIDTNAAMLFLSETHVWKLKRAVDLGFLDFTTLAERRRVCEAELELNRRTAPDLYLAVQAITRGADGALAFDARCDGGGEVLDYVITMRRFPDEALLSEVAARGGLTPAMLRDLADGIALFHQAAAVSGDRQGAARMAAVIAGNARSFASLAAEALPADKVAAWLAGAQATLARVSPLLDARAQAGALRHCHGDLHLANICLWQGRPMAFDCLEFSEALATTDVLYDLAFLLMDLWERGLRREANLVFNRYCDCAGQGRAGQGDWPKAGPKAGVPALPLFLSVRAAIRAHVGAAGALRQSDKATQARKLGEARAYLDAALAFLESAAPVVVAVGGLSGTGKSTLAGALAPLLGAAPGARWLRSDVIRKGLAGLAPEQRLPPEAYTKAASAQVYAELEAQAGALAAQGWPVVVDAVFAREQERAAVAAAGKPFIGLWLAAPEAVMVERVEGRRVDPLGDASDADAAVVRAQGRYDTAGGGDWVGIDAGGSPEQTLAAACAALEQHGFILQKP